MQRPDFRVRHEPPASGVFERIKIVLNVGFFHGLATAETILAMSKYFEVVYIYLDEDNPWERRFWRFMSATERKALQRTIFRAILKKGYPEEQIIRGAFDPEDYVAAVIEKEPEVILAATFPKIPTPAIQLVKGRFILLHPTGKLHGNFLTLPLEMQGPRVMDGICNVSEAEYRIAMLQGLPIIGGRGWDAGPILELGPMQVGPKFLRDELPIVWKPGDKDPPIDTEEWKRLALRVKLGQLVTAQGIPPLLFGRLLRNLVSLDYALGTGMSPGACYAQGWKKEEILTRVLKRRGVLL